jgi:hypothetical protein
LKSLKSQKSLNSQKNIKSQSEKPANSCADDSVHEGLSKENKMSIYRDVEKDFFEFDEVVI